MSGSKDLTFVLLGEDKSASSTMSNTAKVAEKATSRIGTGFASLSGIIGGEFGEILSKTSEGLSQVGEHAGKLSAGLAVGGAAVTGVGVALQKMGSADKQASDQLEQSVKNTGHSYADYREEIEKTISKQEGYGHSAVDTQNALQKLTQATNDPKKALEQMGLTANLAASRHISLSDAADMVDKVISGRGSRTLTEYGITMKTSGDKTKNAQAALEELSGKLSGQADASVNNFGAKVNAVKTRVEDWGAAMAQKVGPVLTAIGPVLAVTGTAMELFKMRQQASTAAALAGDVVEKRSLISKAIAKTVTIAGAVATGVATAAQWAWNAAMDANPIGLIILAVVALVAGLVWFFTQTKLGQQIWSGFTKFLAESWNWLWTTVLQPVINAIGAAFNWLLNVVIVPFAKFTADAVNTIGSVIGTVFGAIGKTIQDAFAGAVGFVKGEINGIIDVINGAIGGINVLIGAVNSIPGVHIGKLGLLPHLAEGGTMTQTGMALVGENGPEVVKLPAGATVYPHGGVPATQQGASGGGIHIGQIVMQKEHSVREYAQELGFLMRST